MSVERRTLQHPLRVHWQYHLPILSSLGQFYPRAMRKGQRKFHFRPSLLPSCPRGRGPAELALPDAAAIRSCASALQHRASVGTQIRLIVASNQFMARPPQTEVTINATVRHRQRCLLADEINSGFFGGGGDAGGRYGGPEPRSWQRSNISVNVSALATDEGDLVKQASRCGTMSPTSTLAIRRAPHNITYTDSGFRRHTSAATFLDALSCPRWITSATVNVPRNWTTGIGTGIANGINSSYFQTLVYETGHALGLGHSGHYDGGGAAKLLLQYKFHHLRQRHVAVRAMSYNDQT